MAFRMVVLVESSCTVLQDRKSRVLVCDDLEGIAFLAVGFPLFRLSLP